MAAGKIQAGGRNLHERERHKLLREALRLAYQSAVGDGAGPAGWSQPARRPDSTGTIQTA